MRLANEAEQGDSASSSQPACHNAATEVDLGASPLSLLNAYLCNLDLPDLKRQNEDLKVKCGRLRNMMRDLGEEDAPEEHRDDEKSSAIASASKFSLTLNQEQKKPNGNALKSPPITDTKALLDTLSDASSYSTIPAPKPLRIQVQWIQKRCLVWEGSGIEDSVANAEEFAEEWHSEGCGIEPQNWPEGVTRNEAQSLIAPHVFQVYNASKDKVLAVVVDYDEGNTRRVRDVYMVVWQKGKVKSVERGS